MAKEVVRDEKIEYTEGLRIKNARIPILGNIFDGEILEFRKKPIITHMICKIPTTHMKWKILLFRKLNIGFVQIKMIHLFMKLNIRFAQIKIL